MAKAADQGTARQATDRPRPLSEPPRRQATYLPWLVLLLLLLLGAAPLLMEIQRPDAVDPDEALAVLTTVQTWRRSAQLADDPGSLLARFVPRRHHRANVDDPPGLTWMQMLTVGRLTTRDAQPGELVLWARLTSVAMAMLALAAVFWAGHSVDRLPTATLAALVCASCPLFVEQGRLATTAMAHLGWGLTSIAAAFWAIRPLRPLPSTERQFIGWIVCGLTLGAATLTAGPITLATVAAPIFLFILLCPDRIGHLIGLLAALLIAVLLVVPWLVFAHEQDPAVWAAWLRRITVLKHYDLTTLLEHSRQRGAMLAIAVFPWIPWLIAALIQPFSDSARGGRLRLLLGTLWFLLLALLILPMPTPPQPADLLPLVPAAALAVAQLFHHYAEMASTGRFVRSWRWIRWPYLLALLAGSAATAAAMRMPRELAARGWVPVECWTAPVWVYALGAAAALVLLALYSGYSVWRHYPGRTLVLWSLWWMMLMALWAVPLTRGRDAIHPLRGEARALAEAVKDGSTVGLDEQGTDHHAAPPGLLLYGNIDWPEVRLGQLRQAVAQWDAAGGSEPLYLVLPEALTPPLSRFAERLDLPVAGLKVWRLVAPPTPTDRTQESPTP